MASITSFYTDQPIRPNLPIGRVWKFYASVNFNDTNPIWEDAPALFEYISRSQSLLQQGNHNNDVLVYWPIHDSWAKFNRGNPLVQFAIHRLDTWLSGTPFYETVHHLIQEGIASTISRIGF